MPWLQHLAPFDCAFEGGEAFGVATLLSALGGDDVQFEWSGGALGALEYERRVAAGFVPTRDVAHDWFNGLVWLRYPRFKKLLNQGHLAESGRGGFVRGNGRTPLRDALTLYDEVGAVLLSEDPHLIQALLAHDWQAFFVAAEAAWLSNRVRLNVVGHGLLEAMCLAHKGLCAKVLPVWVDDVWAACDAFESLLCALLAALTGPANFSPLPVMGVPGWFEASRALGFYEDETVFRAKPTGLSTSVSKRLAFRWVDSKLTQWKCAGQSLLAFGRGEESLDSCEQSAG